MENIKKLLNLKILNIIEKLNNNDDDNIIKFIDKKLLNLNIKLVKKNNNIKEILIYLIENDANFLIIHNNLKSIELFLKKQYKFEINEDQINDIIIEYLERSLI
jgi:hypothetical protein